MIVGVLSLEFRLVGLSSLKDKRKISASLRQKLRNKFNLAVSEVDAQDSLYRLVLAAVTVAGETRMVESRLSKVLSMVEAASPVELTQTQMEIFGA